MTITKSKKLRLRTQMRRIFKTERLRRAVPTAAERELPKPVGERLAALHALRKSLYDRNVDFDKGIYGEAAAK